MFHLFIPSPGAPSVQGKNNIQNSCRQRPTLGFGSKGFNLRVIFRLPLSISCTHSLSLSLSQRDLVFVKATNGNFQLGSEGGERKGVRGKCEMAPSKDSIRRDQIKLLASSAPEADSLTMCPIWASGTAGAGALGGPEVTATSCTSTPGDPDNNTDNNTKDISSQIPPYRESLQRGCHVGSRQCVTVLR